MREMHLRIFAMSVTTTLLLVPAYTQQSHWASEDDKTAKYIVEMERKWAEGVCVDNGVVAGLLADDHQVPVSQCSASVPDLPRSHVALWQEITPYTVGDLAGIDPVVLLLGSRNGSEHEWMRHLHLLGVRKQMVIDPTGKNRRFHSDRAGLRHRPNSAVQFAAR